MVKKTLLSLGMMSIIVSGALATSDFTYKSYGGISDKEDSYKFITSVWGYTEGIAADGPWWREGNFSSTVPWGDQLSTEPYNARDFRDPHNVHLNDDDDSWPALSWGRDVSEDNLGKANDPFIPFAGDETTLGGSSGMGITGYGYGPMGNMGTFPGHPLNIDEDSVFAPFGSFTHYNNSLNYVGSMSLLVSWSLELFDADENPVFDNARHYHFNINQWETMKNTTPCPRSGTNYGTTTEITDQAGVIVNDLAYNTDEHNVILDFTGDGAKGLDNDFLADGGLDNSIGCSDPFAFGYVEGTEEGETPLEMTDRGLVDTFSHNMNTYELLYTGFYDQKDLTGTCNEINLGQDANWTNVSCFEQSNTLWSEEGGHNVGYVRIQVNTLDQGCTPGYWKTHDVEYWTTYTPQQSYASVFGVNPYEYQVTKASTINNKLGDGTAADDDETLTLGEALWIEGNVDGLGQVVRSSVAAILNIEAGLAYYIDGELADVAKIQAMVSDAFDDSYGESAEDIHLKLDEANNDYNNDVC